MPPYIEKSPLSANATPAPARPAAVISALNALLAILTLAIPLYVIRPFRPQSPRGLALALTVRELAPWLTIFCALITIVLLVKGWRSRPRIAIKLLLIASALVACATVVLSRINIFEKMFHPYPSPVFVTADTPIDPQVEQTDKLLSITLAGQTHAFPIRTMGYHHIVNDTLAGQPIAATYCTLCHTGIIYSRRLDGRTLYFTLAGINNGNALLRDRETGSIWQQSTGEAIFGPLKGQSLTVLPSDELTFALWRTERPGGLVLKPDPPYASLYDPRDWEAHIARTHVVLDTSATGIDPHTLMLGVLTGPPGHQAAKAFPIQSILTDRLIEDRLPAQPILIIVGPDNASIRVFSAQLPGQPTPLAFSLASGNLIADRQTASTWNFSGCATTGPLTGKCLPQLEAHKDFWFDWHNHHPDTRVFHG